MQKLDLSKAEERIFKLLIQGLTNDQIAQRTGLSIGGVKFQNTAIYKKFKVKGKLQLMVKVRSLK